MLKSVLMMFVPGYGKAYRFRFYLRLREFYRRHGLEWFGICLKNKILKVYGCELSTKAIISPKAKFMHTSGIVIGDGVVVGDGTILYSGVCLGRKHIELENDYPTIGKNCVLSTGVKVLGNVHIVDNVIIGANAVVIQDIERGGTYAGVPARRIK